ncbi:MAG: diguanylate cyclase [Meiothermus sp.]|nr:diguanylate cyclase [Meiothermus sp.]
MEANGSGLEDILRLNLQAWALTRTEVPQAVALAQQALEQARKVGFKDGEAQALRTLGVAYYLQARHEEAFAALTQGRDLAHQLHDWATERDCLSYLGAVFSMLGELDSALESVEQAYQASLQLGDPGGVSASLNNLGNLYDQMGRYQEALESKLEAVEITRKNGDQTREATFWGNLVVSYNHVGQLERAVASAHELLQFVADKGRPDVEVRTLVNLGEALGKLGRFNEAREVLSRAESRVREMGMREGEVYCNLNMSLVYLAEKLPDPAIASLTHALEIAQMLGARELQAQIHQRMSEAYCLDGRFESALEHYQIYHALERDLRAEQIERKMRVFGTQRKLEKAQDEAKIAHLENVKLKELIDRLERTERELRHKTKELEVQATQDPLTQLYNRRYLEQTLSHHYAEAQNNDQKLSVMLCDVDNFKKINDNFSHQIGDVVLQTVAYLMRDHCRGSDIVARYGGEEFVVVMPYTPIKQAVIACERLRETIQNHDWAKVHPDLRVTISMGLTADTSHPNHEKMLDTADAKLYVAKRSGKNRLEY